MMKLWTKILLFLILFAIIDTVIPVPITTLILLYVLFEKPTWFKDMVSQIYGT